MSCESSKEPASLDANKPTREVTVKIVPRDEHFAHHDDEWAKLTPMQRVGMVWPMTKEAYGLGGEGQPEPRLQRHVVRVVRRRR